MNIIPTNCRKCHRLTGEIDLDLPKNRNFRKNRQNLCLMCYHEMLEYSKKINRERLSINNPMRDKLIREKVTNTLKKKYKSGELISPFQNPEKLKWIHSKRGTISDEAIKHMSDRMRRYNPMFSETTRKKVSATIQARYDNGEIKCKRGTNNPLYKGNRTFSNDCRKWLRKWIKSVMMRDKYTCTVCGKIGGYLHVHHITPLRDIIKNTLTMEHVSDIVALKVNNIVKYEELLQKVIDIHKMEDGITVCKQCHANIDDRYRRIKKTNFT